MHGHGFCTCTHLTTGKASSHKNIFFHNKKFNIDILFCCDVIYADSAARSMILVCHLLMRSSPTCLVTSSQLNQITRPLLMSAGSWSSPERIMLLTLLSDTLRRWAKARTPRIRSGWTCFLSPDSCITLLYARTVASYISCESSAPVRSIMRRPKRSCMLIFCKSMAQK